MTQLTLTVEMIVEIPSKAFTAKVTRVVNSHNQDITANFTSYCTSKALPLTSQAEIEVASERFTNDFQNSGQVLP